MRAFKSSSDYTCLQLRIVLSMLRILSPKISEKFHLTDTYLGFFVLLTFFEFHNFLFFFLFILFYIFEFFEHFFNPKFAKLIEFIIF